jgi:5-methylcytosine-specific restriction enzyme A
MNRALHINNGRKDLLEEILYAQKIDPGTVCFIQPPSPAGRIGMLAKAANHANFPIITSYFSPSSSRGFVSYRAKIVNWKNKTDLRGTQELVELNEHVNKYQPKEENGIYLNAGNGKPCTNLIFIIELEELTEPIPVSCFIKKNGTPLDIQLHGNCVEVYEQPELVGKPYIVKLEDLDAAYQSGIRKSLLLSSDARKQRLENAPKKPESIQVLSRAFRRNPDVAAEVLLRAEGRCQRCNAAAPFIRASNETPYLEVHHRVMLAAEGEDTVENATALCPNCHREVHFGKLNAAE